MQRQKQNNSALWLVLGGAFVLHILLAAITKGYPYDMSCFVAWGEKLLADGPAGFYSDGYFADYPPGYLLVLGLVALVRRIFAIPYEAKLTYVLLAVVPSLCDCAAAALVWKIGQEKLPGSRLPLLLAAYYGLGIFTLAHCMHERYMVPGVVLTLLAAARWDDIRLFAVGFGMSLTGFINLCTVYSLTGSDDEWLTSATSSSVAILVGLAETVCFVLLLFAVWDIVANGHTLPLPARMAEAAAPPAAPAPQPKWQRKEILALLALTAATAVVSFAYLGSRTAPQNPLDATGTTLTETVTAEGGTAVLWVYPGISYGGRLTVADAAGTTLYEKELDYSTCFSWTSVELYADAGEVFHITVENAQVFELALRSADGALVPVTGGGALFDEQDAVPETISQLNSMYFDEIYHGRTGYEQLHRLPVYETTHPPLGKDFIMLGIALFGMTAFGWRFAGTLFGVLLVPLAWCFVRRLTRRPWAAAMAGVLLALDFMRFSQSRLATIDIYGTFFILLGAYCMVWYCQRVLAVGVNGAVLPMALGGLAFGLGCAAKWTGIYAGAGLAVLYLGVLYARWRQGQPGFGREFRTAFLGGIAFYVVLPLSIYIASYLPYWWRDPGFGLADWWRCQVSMYNYHSTLEATHPFESRWYTWLLGLRPVWYYRNAYLPAGLKASIAGMAGPVIWLGGLAALLWLLWRQVSGRGSYAGAGALILYGTQLIPWMLVSRCTFLYHYFPSSMFCLAALALVLATAQDQRRAKRLGAVLCAAALVLFVWYYPALSGLPIAAWRADLLNLLPSFGFY